MVTAFPIARQQRIPGLFAPVIRRIEQGSMHQHARSLELKCAANLAQTKLLKRHTYSILVIFVAIEHKKPTATGTSDLPASCTILACLRICFIDKAIGDTAGK